jgi:hypothetical protein
MDRIATLHVVRERPRRQLVVMGRMLTDRWRLRHVDGLVFAKVLGTGRGADTGPSADLLRQAYFLVWRDPAAAERFLETHPLTRRWEASTVEHQLMLRLVSGFGTWSGRAPLEGMGAVASEGEIVVLTRARIRPSAWRSFRRVSREISFVGSPGLRWTLGVGELPVGLLGTLSCWRSASDLEAAVAGHRAHHAVTGEARDWFAESLFARFAPVDLSDPNREPDRSAPTDRVTRSG